MINESEITPSEIGEWLKENKHSREWLAEQTGASATTVAGWLATGKPRPIPAPTLKLIERLMCDDLLGQPEYSYADAKIIRQAMAQEGYNSLRDFVRDAVVANAKTIMSARDAEKAASTAVENTVRFEVPAGSEPDEHARWIEAWGGIAAGAQITGDKSEKQLRVSKEYPPDHYALQVFGKSMEPMIPDRSYIVVKPWRDKGYPKKGTIVVYFDGHGTSLKEFGYRKGLPGEEFDPARGVPVLRSLNKSVPEVQMIEGGRIDAIFVEVL